MKVTLIQETPNPVETIANIATICYGKDKAKNPKKLVENLLRLKHLSVFEHVYFTWKIEGISRTCLAQLTRHRHCSFTVRSSRYCNESEQNYIYPQSVLEDNSLENAIFTDVINFAIDSYNQLIKLGVKKEDARFILPQALETELYMSCNLRELLHIYKLRSHKSAQWEIRELVEKLRESVNPELDFMFEMVVNN